MMIWINIITIVCNILVTISFIVVVREWALLYEIQLFSGIALAGMKKRSAQSDDTVRTEPSLPNPFESLVSEEI